MTGDSGQAVVIGASFAGLLAASALSQRFGKVTVFDRDTLPDGPEPRPGVPQGAQAHALHGRGAQALEELLPGILREMSEAGAVTFDPQRDMRWYVGDYIMNADPSGLSLIAMSRLHLEHLIRRRVAALPGVSIVGGTVVDGLAENGGRVTGVVTRPGAAGAQDAPSAPETVEAALVVDASGRGSRAPHWLRELGYPEPEATEIKPNIVYLTRRYEAGPAMLDGLTAVVAPSSPGKPRAGGGLPEEGGRFAVMLIGMLGENPPADDEGMLEYARSLPAPEFAAVIEKAKPVSSPVKTRYPASVRRHYDKLGRRLEGFLAAGDALCSFNPVYGQGITIAALEALSLRDVLAAGTGAGLARRWYRAAGKLVASAWMMSAGGDLRYPEIEGKRTPADGIFGAYMDKLNAAASVDAKVATAFIRVANMLDSPYRLMSPGLVLRVLRFAGQARPAVPDGTGARKLG